MGARVLAVLGYVAVTLGVAAVPSDAQEPKRKTVRRIALDVPFPERWPAHAAGIVRLSGARTGEQVVWFVTVLGDPRRSVDPVGFPIGAGREPPSLMYVPHVDAGQRIVISAFLFARGAKVDRRNPARTCRARADSKVLRIVDSARAVNAAGDVEVRLVRAKRPGREYRVQIQNRSRARVHCIAHLLRHKSAGYRATESDAVLRVRAGATSTFDLVIPGKGHREYFPKVRILVRSAAGDVEFLDLYPRPWVAPSGMEPRGDPEPPPPPPSEAKPPKKR